MPSLLELALAHIEAGISIIPLLPRRAIAPNARSETPCDCREYLRRRIATPKKIGEWFGNSPRFRPGVVLGRISGGLECLSLTSGAVARIFRQLVAFQGGIDLLERLPAARATHGGTRLYYRCPSPARGYSRLAQLEMQSEPKTVKLRLLAFVQGDGTWTALPGLPAGVGDVDEIFEWVGGNLMHVPTLTEDDRQLLLESASCLNSWADPSTIFGSASPQGFDARISWDQILVPLSWKKVQDFGDVAVWHTPERTKPGFCAVSGIGLDRDLLYMTGTGRAFTKSGAVASFHLGGDVEKARSLRLPAPVSRWETPTGTRYLSAIQKAQLPLVSCIMPTTGKRRHFLPQAIKYFQRQSYPNLELVIVCDGEDNLSDLLPLDEKRIRYCHLGRDHCTIGTKRNLACEQSRGDLIAHFDDDDWSHPDRVRFQVGALLAEGAEVCRLSQLSFFEINTKVAWLCRTPALLHPSLSLGLPAGGTLLYRRSYWSSSPFPDISLGEDMAFIASESRRDFSVLVPDYRLYVTMIHGSNTSDYSGKSSYWSPWPGDIREIMGTDLDFYLSP